MAEGSRERWVAGMRWVGVGHEWDWRQSCRDGLDGGVRLSRRRGERRRRGHAALRTMPPSGNMAQQRRDDKNTFIQKQATNYIQITVYKGLEH